MKTIWIATLVVIVCLTASGCGTIINLWSGDPDVYGGVQKDVNFVMTPRFGGSTVSGTGNGLAYFAVLVAADVGLSLVGDTLTLPLVLHMRHIDQDKEQEIDSVHSEKEKAENQAQENLSLDKLQPSQPSAQPRD